MSLTPDDFISMVKPEDKELIEGIVSVLEVLKSMDADRINALLSQIAFAKPLFPKDMLPMLDSLEIDFTLVVAFIDQAKKFDRSQWLLKEAKNEGTKTRG